MLSVPHRDWTAFYRLKKTGGKHQRTERFQWELEGFDKSEIYFSPSLARLPNCGSAKCRAWHLTDRLALAKMSEINTKKGAFCVISAEVDTASGLREPLDVAGGTGCEWQGWGTARGSFGVGGCRLGAGVGLGFDGQRAAYGSWEAICPQSWGCTHVFLELYTATCANLLELVN